MHTEMLMTKTSLVKEEGCVLMGYLYGKKGWHVYDIEKGEYFVSHDVVFHEGLFPYVEDMERHLGHRDESLFTPNNTIF